jgi:hypothetical protein
MVVDRQTGWPISVDCDDNFEWKGNASQNGEQVAIQIKMKFDQQADLQLVEK